MQYCEAMRYDFCYVNSTVIILMVGMQDTLAEVFMAPWLGFDSFFH